MAVQRVINCFFFFLPFHNARRDIAPLHSWGSLLVSEGGAYTDFTTCIIIAHHIRERLWWERERKRRSPRLSVSEEKEEQRSALNYHHLTENLPSYSCHLFVKSPFWSCSATCRSVLLVLLLLSANVCFKVPFCGEMLSPTITQISLLTKHIFILNQW